MPFTDPDLESLFYYAKLLLERLPDDRTDRGAIDLGDTTLQFIGHEAGLVSSGALRATDSDGQIETFTGRPTKPLGPRHSSELRRPW